MIRARRPSSSAQGPPGPSLIVTRAAGIGAQAPLQRLQYALLSQPSHLGFAEPEPAEDLGILLAELRGERAHPHTLADLDRGADVRDVAQFGVDKITYRCTFRPRP